MNFLTLTKISMSVGTFLTINYLASSVYAATFTETTSTSNVPVLFTSISEVKDTAPMHWAYESLRSLIQRYNCISGYSNQTYRGNSALSRYEFAYDLRACMDWMERLIQENVSVLKEDTETLKRLAQEFEAELTALGGRVENLESRVFYLENFLSSLYSIPMFKGQVSIPINVSALFSNSPKGIDSSLINVDRVPTVTSQTSSSQTVPEPTSVLGLIAVGVLGASLTFKHKKTVS